MYEDWCRSKGKGRRRSCYLNELPDEILQDILSRLGVKEAAKTCVLSRRWRSLWTSSTTYETSPSVKCTRGLLAATYTRRYDEYDASSGAVVVRYRGRASALDSMVLAFDKEKNASIRHDYSKLNDDMIQKWLSCVDQGGRIVAKRPIPIPFAPVLDSACRLQRARLTSMCFDSVALSYKDFINCTKWFPFLETLVVVNAPMYKAVLGNFGMDRLKHLEIRYCKNLRYLRIYWPQNLETLKLAKNGKVPICILGQMRKSASVYLEGTFCVKTMTDIQRAVPQLEQLELNMDLIREMSLSPTVLIPEFNSVKHLKLIFDFSPSQRDLNINLMDMALFAMVCPFLQKFTLVYGCRKLRRQQHKAGTEYLHCNEESMKSYTHQHLQVVEFIGWCGQESEVQLANVMIKVAARLQDLVFYPHTPQHVDRSGARTFDEAGGEPDSAALASARRLIKKFKIIKSSRAP